jgi:Tfp pilus assembly protein PilO
MIQLKTKSQTIVAISLLSLLVAVLLTILVLVPQFSKLKELSSTANAKQEQLRLGREKVKSIKDGITLIANSKQDIDLLGVAIPKSPEAESALLQVSTAASMGGVTISSVSVSDSKGQLGVSISISGAYDKTMDFLSKIEQSLRPTQLVDITIGTVEGTDLSSTLNLNFPYLAVDAEASPTPSASGAVTPSDSAVVNTGAI